MPTVIGYVMAIGPLKQKEEVIVEPKGQPKIVVESPQKIYESEKKIVKGKQNIWYVWIVIEVILIFRFTLLLLGAQMSKSYFGIFIDIVSTPLVIVFNNLFPSTQIPDAGIVIEWSTFFAMLVYSALAWLVSLYVKFRKPISPEEVEKKLKQDEKSLI